MHHFESHPFATSPAGARALANLYTLVETAQANGWDPWRYLKALFTALPAATTVDHVEALLPWNIQQGKLMIWTRSTLTVSDVSGG